VLFSGSWRFYRDLVIIDACTIDVIVLGMSTRSVRSQTAVSAGEPIGTVMQPGPDTIIHLQVRKRGTPINPFGPLVRE
jgi:septal ring factor EnvC (AmiA/AmiB activator)